MSIFVAAVHMSGGTSHEHIAQLVWMDGSFKSGINSTAEVVDFIEKQQGEVKVSDGKTKVPVGVVREAGKKPFLRTHADGKWTDNLLALPRY